MDRERLKELREEVCELLRCPMSVWNGTGYEYVNELTESGRDLLALIDAEMARQSVTDNAVQRAIEDLESGYHRAEMLDDDYIDLPISTETIALAITALRQYQKPTNEEVHPDDLDSATEDAVEWLEHMKSCHIDSWNKADDEDTAEPGAYEQYKATLKALDLAIQALCQMKGEPK